MMRNPPITLEYSLAGGDGMKKDTAIKIKTMKNIIMLRIISIPVRILPKLKILQPQIFWIFSDDFMESIFFIFNVCFTEYKRIVCIFQWVSMSYLINEINIYLI